jgi:glycosyltransferase involved in cell wall biosynthesis
MSRFPKLSETFVLYEILALEEEGASVDVFPLLREREAVVHPDAEPLVARAHYLPFLSLPILSSNLRALGLQPGPYLRTLRDVLMGTVRSANFFVGAIGIFPKVVHAARLMRAAGVAHVHCHFATHPALAGLIVHRLTGIPYSFTAHGSDLHVDRTMLPRKVEEAAFVVAISDYNRNLILDECGRQFADKVVVVHCGVDTQVFAPLVGKQVHDGPLSILCVGTLHEVKGQRYLVEACARLAAEGVDFHCELVGSGPDQRVLEQLIASKSLEGRVVLAGSLTREEVAARVRRADVLAAPSVPTAKGKREGIPVVLMEALGAGVPAVASRLSGIPELVVDGDTGLLVPPGDSSALAAALRRLAADPGLRRRLGAAGRRKVLAEFDQRRSARALAALFAQGAEP